MLRNFFECFFQYLFSITYVNRIPPKRVIIRQGQIADSFYFIISGQAMVSIMDDDKKTGESKSRILAVLKEGTCFGVVFYYLLLIVFRFDYFIVNNS